MNKRQKKKNLHFRNKKSITFGLKKGWYRTAKWNSNISIHEDIFHAEEMFSRHPFLYLCRKKIYFQTFYWFSTSPKNKFKLMKICSEKYKICEDIIRFNEEIK